MVDNSRRLGSLVEPVFDAEPGHLKVLLNVSTALRVCLSANYRLGVLPTSIQPFLR